MAAPEVTVASAKSKFLLGSPDSSLQARNKFKVNGVLFLFCILHMMSFRGCFLEISGIKSLEREIKMATAERVFFCDFESRRAR